MTDMNKLKEKLNARLAELTERTDEIEDDLAQPADDDWSENATESEDDEVLQKIGIMAADEIGQIKLALAKIENGSYGVCNGCGKKIAVARLDALPHTSKCIKCA